MDATILVVDDEPSMREFAGRVLADAGYNVIAAATLQEAKERIDADRPDLLLVDVRLQSFNGLQLAVRERTVGGTRPIIMMSGYDDPVLVAEAEHLGASFLSKPFTPGELVGAIGHAFVAAYPDLSPTDNHR
jgi:DNA-binding response OmpR family regulator